MHIQTYGIFWVYTSVTDDPHNIYSTHTISVRLRSLGEGEEGEDPGQVICLR
jgi:hypothetical protein